MSDMINAINMANQAISQAASLQAAAKSNKKTNETNLQIMRETNDANRELAQMQNDWNYKMWQESNEYNSPASQIRLLREAGLNPNLYQNQGATSQPITSADLATDRVGAPMESMRDAYLSWFGLGSANYNSALAMDLQRDQLELEKLRVKNETAKATSEISVNDTLRALNLANVDLTEDKRKEIQQTLKESEQRIAESSERIRSMIQAGELTQKEIDYFDSDKAWQYAQHQVSISNGYKDLEVKASQIGLNEKERDRAEVLIYQECVKTLLYGQNFDLNKVTKEMLENDKEYQKAMNEHKLDTWWIDYGFDKVNTLFNWVTDAATLYYTKGVSGVFNHRTPRGSTSGSHPSSPQSYGNIIDSYDSQADFLGR